LPLVHREPKPTHWFGESIKVYTRRTFVALVPTFSTVMIFGSQTGENKSALPSSDGITDFDTV